MVKLFQDTFLPRKLADLRAKELYEAQRELATAQTALEYAAAMVAYNQTRVARLQQEITGEQNVAP